MVENQSVLKVAKVVKGVGLFYDVTLDFNILYLNLIFDILYLIYLTVAQSC